MIGEYLAALLGFTAPDPNIVQGYVEGDYLYVGSTTAGRLTAVDVREGDRVSAGDRLFGVDERAALALRDQARAVLAEAEARLGDLRKGKRPEELAMLSAAVDEAKAALAYSLRDLGRQRGLVGSGAASAATLDQAQSLADRDQARFDRATSDYALALQGGRADAISAQQAVVEQSRAALARAEVDLSELSRQAPGPALVEDILYRPGEVVAVGTPVVVLLPPENVKVVFFVPEPRLGALRLGQEVAFACDGCPPDLRATIGFVSSRAEYTPPVIYSVDTRAKLVYRVEARPLGPVQALHPGQPVDVRLAAAPAPSAVRSDEGVRGPLVVPPKPPADRPGDGTTQ
ncbi:secretion protein HlyD [Rhodospirillum rubrum]|uniref:HlyD family secretion protein n=1 Tax=Rhodospirillum rubrum TaxID=1085 RepID=UPI00190400AB|nr:HlyD family efflux transporter periplasmic adaptor subunit [Rhodospirillum rubrum]MBK1665178.1 secretion protein HlyD [Rhodospirillum rubrum]MBK1677800.1 secretion protein HlyD [Rhodospirillum rubrum]